MVNSLFLALGLVPAILYNNASFRKLYESYVRLGMSLQELSQKLQIKPALTTTSDNEDGEKVEVFEYESETPEKYVMVFIDGKLKNWHTEDKKTTTDK